MWERGRGTWRDGWTKGSLEAKDPGDIELSGSYQCLVLVEIFSGADTLADTEMYCRPSYNWMIDFFFLKGFQGERIMTSESLCLMAISQFDFFFPHKPKNWCSGQDFIVKTVGLVVYSTSSPVYILKLSLSKTSNLVCQKYYCKFLVFLLKAFVWEY